MNRRERKESGRIVRDMMNCCVFQGLRLKEGAERAESENCRVREMMIRKW